VLGSQVVPRDTRKASARLLPRGDELSIQGNRPGFSI
jgi:hypothetical protein